MRDTLNAVLRAGGYVTPDTELDTDVPVDTIDARVFAHPGIPERRVVRLTPSNLAVGEDAAMDILGYEVVESAQNVALRMRQALGFPEWVLVHDPKNAATALAISRELKREARRAKSKPGNSKIAFDQMGSEIAKKTPHFLPSFYEEVARAFIESGNTAYAASYFGKAREAEQAYALEVDETRRRDAFVEFALSGALTNKVMSDYARDLATRHGNDLAYEYFYDLCVRRTLGGTPPHAQMVAELRKLAKAAGKKQAEEDRRFIGDVWEAPALTRSATKFWETYEKTYTELAKSDARIRGRLLNTFPQVSGKADGFKAFWISFLKTTGADSGVTLPARQVEPAARAEGSAALWLAKMVTHRVSSGYHYYRQLTTPDEGFDLVRRMASRLVEDGIAIKFDDTGWYARVDTDILDLLLELGVPVDTESVSIDLSIWATSQPESAERRRDLSFVGSDERLAEAMDYAVGAVFGQAEFEAAARGKKGLKAARLKWLNRRVSEISAWASPGFANNVERITSVTSATTFAEFGQPWKDLHHIDVVAPLTRTLNGGFLGEFDWPEARAAQAELAGPKRDKAVVVVTQFPYLILHNSQSAIVLGPNGRELHHDMKLPTQRNPYGMRFAGGQLLVVFYDASWSLSAYWSGKPNHIFKGGYMGWGSTYCIPRSDGSVMEGLTAYRAGQEEMPQLASIISDGQTYWLRDGWGDTMHFVEIDPDTGKRGRQSNPAYFEDHLPADFKISAHHCEIYPVHERFNASPLGVKDGIYARVTYVRGEEYKVVSTAGEVDGWAEAFLKFPGSDELRQFSDGFYVSNANFQISATTELAGISGLNRHFAHYLLPVDPKASAQLRSVGDDVVACWLAASLADLSGHQDFRACGLLKTWFDALVKRATQSEVLATHATAASLRLGDEKSDKCPEILMRAILEHIDANTDFVVSLASEIERHAREIQKLAVHLEEANPELAESVQVSLMDSEVWANFAGIASGGDYYFYNYTWGDQHELTSYLATVARFFETGEEPKAIHWVNTDLTFLLPGVAAAGWAAASPGLEGDREKVLTFLEALAASGLLDLPGKMRAFTTRKETWKPHGIQPEWTTFVAAIDGNCYLAKGGYWANDDIRVLEYTTTEFKLPKGVNADRIVDGVRWSSAGARRLVELVRERGPYAATPDVAALLAQKTGSTNAEAGLIWTCLPGVNKYEKNFMPKEVREALGLKVNEASVARDALRTLSAYDKVLIYGAGMPEDPAALWDDPTQAATALASGWARKFGQRVMIPEELLAAVKKELGIWDPRAALTDVLDPEKSSYAVVPKYSLNREDDRLALHVEDGRYNNTDNLNTFLRIAYFVLLNTPYDDSVRQALPAAWELWKKTLKNPDFRVAVESPVGWVEYDKIPETFSKLGPNKALKGVEFYEDDVVWLWPSRWSIDCMVRTAALLDGKTSPHFKDQDAFANIFEIFSPRFSQMMAAIPVEAARGGSFPANPENSAPEIVANAGEVLGVSSNAATAFLQTLALPNPTSSNLKTWNGWTAAQYKKAMEELTARGVVLEAKRARAGRNHFLDGPWLDHKAPRLPIEAWKTPFLADEYTQLPNQALADLFAAAWNRWSSGDRPKF